MTLKIRRMLSLIFIILFLIISPAVILYAAGYKLKTNGFLIQKTGMLTVESKPRGAKILLNGQVQRTLIGSLFNKNGFIATPAKIKNLLPGDYEIALWLDGYLGWRKQLVVRAGATTFAKEIYLFKNSRPRQIASAGAQTINFSPDKNQALVASAGQFVFINLSDGKKISVEQKNLKGENLAWSSDGKKLVIDDYLYDTDDLNSAAGLSKLTPGPLNYKWSDNILFYQDKTSIYQLNQGNLPEKIISNLEFKDYLIKNGYLHLIIQSRESASLRVIDLAANRQIKDIILPAAADYSFINPEQARLNLYDNEHKILYLINPLAAYYPALVEVMHNIKNTFWIDGDNLLYTNDFEIWLYNLPTKKKTLIARIGGAIIEAVMHPNKSHIIYAADKSVNAIELDERGGRNIAELAKFDRVASFILSPRGDKLYLAGKIGNAEGLYELEIQ